MKKEEEEEAEAKKTYLLKKIIKKISKKGGGGKLVWINEARKKKFRIQLIFPVNIWSTQFFFYLKNWSFYGWRSNKQISILEIHSLEFYVHVFFFFLFGEFVLIQTLFAFMFFSRREWRHFSLVDFNRFNRLVQLKRKNKWRHQ